jgi:hypothetical protein
LYGYKNNVYKRIFKKINNVNVEGVYCGQHWEKIRYLDDVIQYINNTYSKKMYSESEIDELIRLIKK